MEDLVSRKVSYNGRIYTINKVEYSPEDSHNTILCCKEDAGEKRVNLYCTTQGLKILASGEKYMNVGINVMLLPIDTPEDAAGQMNLCIDGFNGDAECIQAKIEAIKNEIEDVYSKKLSMFFDEYSHIRLKNLNLQKEVKMYKGLLDKEYKRIGTFVQMPWYKRLFNLKVLTD